MSDIEKGNTDHNGSLRSPRYDIEDHENRDDALRKIRTAGGISISPELFEKIYLTPKNQVKGDIRATVGNPTPLGILGFIVTLGPLSCQLMGWRGSGGGGAAIVGVMYFIGGLLMIISGVMEWILGNTFTLVVLASFGGFWLSLATTLVPSYGAAAAFEPKDPTNPGFNSSFAFYYVFFGLLCFVYLICSLRTNFVFMVIFLTLSLGFLLLAGANFQLAEGNVALAGRVQIASGAVFFVSQLFGWYLMTAQLLISVDFPVVLPVGDLSRFVRGASERKKDL
ncbi:hypothetical protein Plec18167_006729 [Paecilomyces lecythidis]|uniref:Protein alcS n=1 Tax=Paecilomyces lecythidis TaxID=3004212 RepID=A0ABR3X9I4_9EURO